MSEAISIVMPAFRAEDVIVDAVKSVLGQSFADWRLIVVADDGADYELLLGRAGLNDGRIRYIDSGGVGTGASRARNAGLGVIDTAYAAVLDADDRFQPEKLARLVGALAETPIVSTAITDVTPAGKPLRTVGVGADRLLTAGAHKFVNFSMDSMIGWDRRRVDGRYDPTLPNMNDLDFLLQLYRTSAASFHIGTPLHDYVKQPASLSNGEGFTDRMIAAKTTLLERLTRGDYGFADPTAAEGLGRFLETSLAAERSYPAALAAQPGLLFEDHLEPRLRAAATSASTGTAG